MNDTWRPTDIHLDMDWDLRSQELLVVLVMREKDTRRKIGLLWKLPRQHGKTFKEEDVIRMLQGIGRMLETNAERMVYPQVLEAEPIPQARFSDWS